MKILQDGKEVAMISFGEVEFGVRKDILVEIYNDGEGEVRELEFKADPTIQVLNPPLKIAKRQSAYLTLAWIPDANLTQPINTKLEITGKEVFG